MQRPRRGDDIGRRDTRGDRVQVADLEERRCTRDEQDLREPFDLFLFRLLDLDRGGESFRESRQGGDFVAIAGGQGDERVAVAGG